MADHYFTVVWNQQKTHRSSQNIGGLFGHKINQLIWDDHNQLIALCKNHQRQAIRKKEERKEIMVEIYSVLYKRVQTGN